jgi:hypothetical protein
MLYRHKIKKGKHKSEQTDLKSWNFLFRSYLLPHGETNGAAVSLEMQPQE